MADQKISELTAINQADLASDDQVAVVDTSALETKKISVSELDSRYIQTGNATHTGEVTGSGALTVDPTAINNKTSVSAAAADEVLITDASDAGALKRATTQSIADLRSLAAADITGQSSVAAATDDAILISDTSDSGNLKRVTAQSIADLASGGGGNPNPAGTDWIVGYTDYTSNNNFTSGTEIQHGPFLLDVNQTGTGAANSHSNSIIDDESFGVKVFTIGSSASAFTNVSMDLEAFKSGDATVRVGARIKYEDLPVSGGEDYYHLIGFNSKTTNLENTNFAVIGVDLTDSATNFIVKTHGGSSETVTDTGVALAADTWFNLEIELTATACSAWIDGVNVLNASTSNVPVGAVDLNPSTFISFRVGSPSVTRNIYYDWSYVAYKAGTARGSVGSGGPF